jgi:hypothetical protein
VVLAAALRTVAVTKGCRIVPPAARIVGGAEEDLVADVGMLQPDADELEQILRLGPDRQPALVDRRVAEIGVCYEVDWYEVL